MLKVSYQSKVINHLLFVLVIDFVFLNFQIFNYKYYFSFVNLKFNLSIIKFLKHYFNYKLFIDFVIL